MGKNYRRLFNFEGNYRVRINLFQCLTITLNFDHAVCSSVMIMMLNLMLFFQ